VCQGTGQIRQVPYQVKGQIGPHVTTLIRQTVIGDVLGIIKFLHTLTGSIRRLGIIHRIVRDDENGIFSETRKAISRKAKANHPLSQIEQKMKVDAAAVFAFCASLATTGYQADSFRLPTSTRITPRDCTRLEAHTGRRRYVEGSTTIGIENLLNSARPLTRRPTFRDISSTHPWTELYELGRSIGKGANGETFIVTHKTTRTRYALKTSSRPLLREAQALFACKHTDVVRILEFHPNEGSDAILMELLQYPWTTLATYHDARGTLSEEEAIDIFQRVLDAVAWVSRRGYVHADLHCINF
jgi:Protein kinase domain